MKILNIITINIITILFFFTIPIFAETIPEVQKTIVVQNDEGSLSSITSICGSRVYMAIFGEIAYQDFQIWNDLAVLKERGITDVSVMINSDGGSISVAFAIIGLFKEAIRDGFKIDATAVGRVASAALPIFVSFDNRKAVWGTMFMVHESSAALSGTMSQHKSFLIYGELLRNQYFSLMMQRTRIKDREQWKKWERETQWFTLERAIEIGIVPEK